MENRDPLPQNGSVAAEYTPLSGFQKDQQVSTVCNDCFVTVDYTLDVLCARSPQQQVWYEQFYDLKTHVEQTNYTPNYGRLNRTWRRFYINYRTGIVKGNTIYVYTTNYYKYKQYTCRRACLDYCWVSQISNS